MDNKELIVFRAYWGGDESTPNGGFTWIKSYDVDNAHRICMALVNDDPRFKLGYCLVQEQDGKQVNLIPCHWQITN